MSETEQFGEFVDQSTISQAPEVVKQEEDKQKQASFTVYLKRQRMVDPPRQLPKRSSYSLEPDMATGWKPKKAQAIANITAVFPITYKNQRKQNSYMLHEDRKYQNPYGIQKRQEPYTSERPGIPLFPVFEPKNLKFNSNFQCGNLDAAIYISNNQYDLLMRVDSNTRGHNNWYYFTVKNGNFVGSVRFNICNFKRQKSLYQRGLKPYFFSKKNSDNWAQGGQNIRYEKRPMRYKFLYENEELTQMQFPFKIIDRLKTYLTLSFTYHFDTPNDTVEFAYFVPYTYSRLLKFVSGLSTKAKLLSPMKTLSGLSIPIMCITDQQTPDYNKNVLLMTGRIHPGQSNGSYVAEGFIEYACSEQSSAQQFRKKYIAYIIPMLNPDGVVAGNYRTSLFGKDLNRTFNSKRKYAFPESFNLLQFAKDLKLKHKQRFNTFIDLHGHSVKKNIFMYGPQFSIQSSNYYISRQLPKNLAMISPYFRYFSCIFRISSSKSSTSRAMINRHVNVPFTYTMQSSNGFYYDSEAKKDSELTVKKLKKMGLYLCQALSTFNPMSNSQYSFNPLKNISESNQTSSSSYYEQQPPHLSKQSMFQNQYTQQQASDDNISEGNSDSQPEEQDLSDSQLDKLLECIVEQKSENNSFYREKQQASSPVRNKMQYAIKILKLSEKQLKKKAKNTTKNPALLPPINCLNRAKEKSSKHSSNNNDSTTANTLLRGTSPQKKEKKIRVSISQVIQDNRQKVERQPSHHGDKSKDPSFRIRPNRMDTPKAKFFLK